VFVFIGASVLDGKGEGKTELYVQSGQESLSTVVCVRKYTYFSLLCGLSHFPLAISPRCFRFLALY
jgi:hypothetical protein